MEPHWPGDGDSDSRTEFLFWYKRFASGVGFGRLEYSPLHDLVARVAPRGVRSCTCRRVGFRWLARDQLQCEAGSPDTRLWWSLSVEGTDVHAGFGEGGDTEMDWTSFGTGSVPEVGSVEQRTGHAVGGLSGHGGESGDLGSYGVMFAADEDGEELCLEGALEEILEQAMAEEVQEDEGGEPGEDGDSDADATEDLEGMPSLNTPALFQIPAAKPWSADLFACQFPDVDGSVEYKDISADATTFKCMLQLLSVCGRLF